MPSVGAEPALNPQSNPWSVVKELQICSPRRRPVSIALLVMVVSTVVICSIVWLGAKTLWDVHAQSDSDYTESLTKQLHMAFQAHVDEALGTLEQSNMFLTHAEPGLPVFLNWTNTIRAQLPFTAFSWNGLVTPQDSEKWTNTARKAYSLPNVFIRDSAGAPRNVSVMYPVIYIGPLEKNTGAVLFDLYSVPVRAVTLDKAKSTGKMACTNTLKLVQTGASGLIVFYPTSTAYGQFGYLSMVWAYQDLFQQQVVAGVDGDLQQQDVDSAGLGYRVEIIDENDDIVHLIQKGIMEGDTQVRNMSLYVADRTLVFSATVSVDHSDQTQAFLGVSIGLAVAIFACFVLIVVLIHKAGVAAESWVARTRAYMRCIAHDVKTPISVIGMLLEILQTEQGGQRGMHKAKSARSEADKALLGELAAAVAILRTTVSNMMVYESASYDTKWQEPVTITTTSIRRMIGKLQSVLRLYNPGHLDLKPIKFSVADNVPSRVMVDESILTRIVMNLLSNSYKFAGATKIVCSVHCERTATATQFSGSGGETGPLPIMLTVTVSDEGPGIPDGELKNVFKAFHRVPRSASQVEGTGLGLSMVKAGARRLGGDVSVTHNYESSTGTGCVFSVSVPVVVSHDKGLDFAGKSSASSVSDDRITPTSARIPTIGSRTRTNRRKSHNPRPALRISGNPLDIAAPAPNGSPTLGAHGAHRSRRGSRNSQRSHSSVSVSPLSGQVSPSNFFPAPTPTSALDLPDIEMTMHRSGHKMGSRSHSSGSVSVTTPTSPGADIMGLVGPHPLVPEPPGAAGIATPSIVPALHIDSDPSLDPDSMRSGSVSGGDEGVPIEPSTLLLVEDTVTVYRVMLMMLTRIFPDCKVINAATCAEAKGALLDPRNAIDVVLLDETLPDGSGSEMFSKLVEECAENGIVLPPALLHSNIEDPGEVAMASRLSGWIAKGSSLRILREEISQVLKDRQEMSHLLGAGGAR